MQNLLNCKEHDFDDAGQIYNRNSFMYYITQMTEKILDKIIRPEYRSKLGDWANYIKESQVLGLQIIDQIYSSKGNQHVSILLPKEKILYETQQSMLTRKHDISLEQAEQKFRRKQLTTSYQFHHGYSLSKPRKSNIFEFKTLQKLDLAKPITSMTVSFIDNWLQSKDKLEYQQFVLRCLRSIKAKVEVAKAGDTEMRTAYNWRIDPKLSEPLRMDKICEDLFAFKPNVEAIKRQEQKQRKLRERIAEIEKTDFAKQLIIYKDFKIN